VGPEDAHDFEDAVEESRGAEPIRMTRGDRAEAVRLTAADWLKICGVVLLNGVVATVYIETRMGGLDKRITVLETRRDQESAALDRIERLLLRRPPTHLPTQSLP
jgi:hypothetical protein